MSVHPAEILQGEVGGWKCKMWREGRPLMGRGGYIIGSDRKYLYNIIIRDIRVPTYQRMFLAELRGYGKRRTRRHHRGEILLAHFATQRVAQ